MPQSDSQSHLRPRILHVSADFPDPWMEAKTRVIKTLIDLTGDRFEHSIVSINRVSPGSARFAADLVLHFGRPKLHVETKPFGPGESIAYEAPGRGIFHATMLERLGDYIAKMHSHAQPSELLVGHKLTVEGIAVLAASERTGTPFAVTIQGDTDTKILSARPDLAPLLRRVFHKAVHVTSFTPWALDAVEAKLGKRQGPVSIVPCPTELDVPLVPTAGGAGLVSVFHLASQRRKNLAAMASACNFLAAQGTPVPLGIVGGGSASDVELARRTIGNAQGVVLEGALDRMGVSQRINASSGFVLPSKRETFGLVFIEALMAGAPIIYPQGQAVSGYFNDCPFAIGVPPDDVCALGDAMLHLVRHEARLKTELAKWQSTPAAQRFQREAIARDYGNGLACALGQPGYSCSDRPGLVKCY